MLGLALKSAWFKRVSRGIPVARLLLVGEVAMMASRHLARLDRDERRRLVDLIARTRGRRGTLSATERDELSALIAKLEPRVFVGSAVKRLSPVPMPKRLLFGPRGGAARKAISSGEHR